MPRPLDRNESPAATQTPEFAALADLRARLRPDQVRIGPRGRACIDGPARARSAGDATIRVMAEGEVDCRTLVGWAGRHGLSLYPVSTGRNWGYGTDHPVRPDSVLVDLSRMDRVIEFDPELGTVTLEPGVTQRGLRAFLDARGAEYLVPVTGAGPDASIVGNALERGYGITPYADHFGALTALRAVLADGSIYRSALGELGAERADRCFKWGIGPYIDGLFTQGGFGIVTRATIALAKAPREVGAFLFTVNRASDLEPAVAAVRDVLHSVGANTGSINLLNTRRALSMAEPYPRDRVAAGGVMSDELVAALGRKHGLGPWLGIGSIYAEPGVARATRRAIRRRLKGLGGKLVFLSRPRVRFMQRALRPWPGERAAALRRKVEALDKALANFAGEPSEVALPLCYWKGGRLPEAGMPLDPARDGCGLIWYSPLVVMDPHEVRRYVQFVERTCLEHGIEPLITLTSLSPRCFDSTVPLLFEPTDAAEAGRARACYEALLEGGRRLGFMPYRVPTAWMGRVARRDQPWSRTTARLKQALDPNGIIAPGRYAAR